MQASRNEKDPQSFHRLCGSVNMHPPTAGNRLQEKSDSRQYQFQDSQASSFDTHNVNSCASNYDENVQFSTASGIEWMVLVDNHHSQQANTLINAEAPYKKSWQRSLAHGLPKVFSSSISATRHFTTSRILTAATAGRLIKGSAKWFLRRSPSIGERSF